MNSFTLMGNLTKDPELTEVGNEKLKKCKFTVAVKRPNTKDVTDFIPCTAWRNSAENIAKFFSKGRKILVSGYMTSNTYESDGKKVTGYDWTVTEWEFCDKGVSAPSEMDTGTYVEEPVAPKTKVEVEVAPATASTSSSIDDVLPF